MKERTNLVLGKARFVHQKAELYIVYIKDLDMEMDTESLVQLVKSIDTINSRLQVLENSKFNAHLTEEKLLHLESFAGVLERKIDSIERYRDFKEKRFEELKQKIGIIISATLISIFVFTIGYCCGVLQWK